MIFLDTSGLLCLFDASDAKHQTAKTYFEAVSKLKTLRKNHVFWDRKSQVRDEIQVQIMVFDHDHAWKLIKIVEL